MRFEILGHASMLVDTRGCKLVLDPWLVGSCYWRSWWNYPKPPPFTGKLDELDYIYLTHHHWDHFHGPSLRKLPKSAKVLVPKAPSPRLVRDLESFGFAEIIELPHAKPFQAGEGLTLTSYHFGLSLDSALVIDDGENVLLDMNDCKLTGRPLRQLLGRHPKIDFLFRSHSNATAYPFCIEAEDETDLSHRTNKDYLTDFVDTAAIVRPAYAIPFASNHCFLHKETVKYNDTTVSPEDVKAYFDDNAVPGVGCEAMVAGDWWDGASGFHLQDHDYFTKKDLHLAEYAKEVAPILERQYRLEERAVAEFEWFQGYFERLLRALPPGTRHVFRAVIGFQLTTRPTETWVVDFDRRVVERRSDVPPRWDMLITMAPWVLRDCVKRNMFSVLMPSKRLSVRLKSGRVKEFFIFLQLLDMHEYDFFPLRRSVNPRFIGAWLRRWREVLYYAEIAAKMATARKAKDQVAAAVPRVA